MIAPHNMYCVFAYIMYICIFGKTSNDVVCDIQGILMYSKDSGASWDTVAQDIHPRYYSSYSIYDFTW